MINKDILVTIVLDNLFPAYTAQLILNDMMEKGVLKINPFNILRNVLSNILCFA